MDICKDLIKIDNEKNISISGLTDAFFGTYLYTYFNKYKKDILVVTPTLYEANKIYVSISNYTENVLLFPMDDFLTSEAISISPDLKISRLECLNELVKENRKRKIVVTHLDGYVRFLPNKKLYMDSILKLDLNTRIEPKALVEKLLNIGYKRETIVTTTGEIGVRGFVIDIYPLGENHPVRLEFFGDEIDSIRYFDEATQRSIKEIKSIKILPNTEDIFETEVNKEHKFLSVENKNIGNIEDYLTNPNFFIKT